MSKYRVSSSKICKNLDNLLESSSKIGGATLGAKAASLMRMIKIEHNSIIKLPFLEV